MMLPIVLLSTIMLALVQNSLGDDGVNDYDVWREALCANVDQVMFEKFEECFFLEDKDVQAADRDCSKQAYPDSDGDGVVFLTAGCKDSSLFKKFDDCFDVYKKDPEFVKKMKPSDKVKECSRKVIDEYNLESLRDQV